MLFPENSLPTSATCSSPFFLLPVSHSAPYCLFTDDAVSGHVQQRNWSFAIFKYFMTISGEYLSGNRRPAEQDTSLQPSSLGLDSLVHQSQTELGKAGTR